MDHLHADEAHNYKNAFLYTKMRNVVGIAQNEAQKSADMFNKCQYLEEYRDNVEMGENTVQEVMLDLQSGNIQYYVFYSILC